VPRSSSAWAGIFFAVVRGRGNPEAFSCPCRSPRLDFHTTIFSRQIVPETRPRPMLRAIHESARHGIAMNVAQLPGKFALAPDVEVVVACLPERLRGAQRQSPRYRLLQRLQGLCQLALFWFTCQSVDVLRHDHEAVDEQFILLAHRLQSADEEIPWRGCGKFWLAVITAEGEGMVLTGLLEMLQRHSMSLLPGPRVVCDR
jgi:hypothetical protein